MLAWIKLRTYDCPAMDSMTKKIEISKFQINNFEFGLFCGSSFERTSHHLARMFDKVFSGFLKGSISLDIPLGAEENARVGQISNFITIPYPFPERDFYEIGMVMTLKLLDGCSFMWRAGRFNLIIVESFKDIENEADAVLLVKQVEPLLFKIALEIDCDNLLIEGSLLNKDDKNILLLGSTNTSKVMFLLSLILQHGYKLISNEVTLINPIKKEYTPFPKCFRSSDLILDKIITQCEYVNPYLFLNAEYFVKQCNIFTLSHLLVPISSRSTDIHIAPLSKMDGCFSFIHYIRSGSKIQNQSILMLLETCKYWTINEDYPLDVIESIWNL